MIGKYLVFILLLLFYFFNLSIKIKYPVKNPSTNELTCQWWNRGQDCASSGVDEHSPVQTPFVCLAALTLVPGVSSCVQIPVHHPRVALGSFQVAHQHPGEQYKHVPLYFNVQTGYEKNQTLKLCRI
jgi:hypothetical protein